MEWVFIDEFGTSVAELTDIAYLVHFMSRLRDGSVVQTVHPQSQNIDEQDLRVSRASTSVADAYGEQRHNLEQRVAGHGDAQPIADMGDWFALDNHYRQRYSQRVLRRLAIAQSLKRLGLSAAAQ